MTSSLDISEQDLVICSQEAERDGDTGPGCGSIFDIWQWGYLSRSVVIMKDVISFVGLRGPRLEVRVVFGMGWTTTMDI